jgi:hypothetical protein
MSDSNPWGVKLKKTGLNAQRSAAEEAAKMTLENKQSEMSANAALNKENENIYKERQASLAVDAMMGQQGRLGGKKKSRKHRSRRNKKSRKSRRRYRR